MPTIAEKKVATTVDATTETRILDKVKILIADALKQNRTADHPTTPTDTPPRITESPTSPTVQPLPEGDANAKLDFMYRELILRMDLMHREMILRFDTVNKRSEDMQKAMDKRFTDLIHYSDKRFSSLQWMIGTGIALVVTLITIYRFVG